MSQFPQSQLTTQQHNEAFQNQLQIGPAVISMRECRICLQGNNNDEQFLVSPCACSGSVQYVHENCLCSWITKQFQTQQIRQQIQNGSPPKCQICKQAYNCQVKIQKKWVTGQIFLQKIKVNITLFIWLISMLGLMTFLLVVSCQRAYNFKKSDEEYSKVQQFSFVTGIIISVVSILVVQSRFIQYFLEYQTLKLTFPYNKYSPNRNEEPIQPQAFQQSQNGIIVSRPIC